MAEREKNLRLEFRNHVENSFMLTSKGLNEWLESMELVVAVHGYLPQYKNVIDAITGLSEKITTHQLLLCIRLNELLIESLLCILGNSFNDFKKTEYANLLIELKKEKELGEIYQAANALLLETSNFSYLRQFTYKKTAEVTAKDSKPIVESMQPSALGLFAKSEQTEDSYLNDKINDQEKISKETSRGVKL